MIFPYGFMKQQAFLIKILLLNFQIPAILLLVHQRSSNMSEKAFVDETKRWWNQSSTYCFSESTDAQITFYYEHERLGTTKGQELLDCTTEQK